MNLAQIIGPTGMVDYERVPLEAPGSPFAQVTVREWDPALNRHEELYRGPMRFAHISTLGNVDRNNRPLE